MIQLINSNFYVYEWYIEETGEIFYVGKGKDNRVTSNKDRNEFFKNIKNKHKCNYRIVAKNLTEDEAYAYEKEYGLQLKSKGQARACYVLGKTDKFIDKKIRNKISKTLKGNVPWNIGKKATEEQKKKMSIAKLGKKQSEETKRKRSESLKGRCHSDETRKKLSMQKLGSKNPSFGKKQSMETRQKKSEGLKGHKTSDETRAKIGLANGKPVFQIDKNTKEVISTFCSASEAGRVLGIQSSKISSVCNKKRKTCGGFIWEYC